MYVKYFVFVIRVPFRCTIRLRIHRTTVLHPLQKSNLKISVMNYNRRAADDSHRLVGAFVPFSVKSGGTFIPARITRTGSGTHLECRQDIIVRPSNARDCCLRNRDCRLFNHPTNSHFNRGRNLVSTLSPSSFSLPFLFFFYLTNDHYALFSLNIIFMPGEKCARQIGRAFPIVVDV